VPEKAPKLKCIFFLCLYLGYVIIVPNFLSKFQGNVISELNRDLFSIADLFHFGFTEQISPMQ